MNKKLKEKILESLSSVLPITLIVLVLSVTVVPMPLGTLMMFLVGAVLLIVGMGFFSLGADISMTPMGEAIGAQITKSKNVPLIVMLCFVIGAIITIAEPDLQVLATQVPSIPDNVLIWTVAVGVGLFFVLATLRTLLGIPLRWILVGFYIIVFIVACFAPEDFLPMAFDSGGVTTGPITVPFIMALGVGMCSVRGDKSAQEDSFGFVAISSIGPILAVLILSIVYNPSTANYSFAEVTTIETTTEMAAQFAAGLPQYVEEVVKAICPILGFFIVFQLITRHFFKRQIIRLSVGVVYTFIGLVLFLTGVNVGFMPAGVYLGRALAESSVPWVLIPLGMLMGYFIVAAEPAVHVLNKQVEEISSGVISSKSMQLSLSIGVALAVGIAMLRVLTGISIMWFLVPGYALAIGMTFFTPKLFTAVAFDSGGVASGPMTATFLLPFAMGACSSLGGDILQDAFGIVAMVAMTPLLTIQILGLNYKRKTRHARDDDSRLALVLDDTDDEIIVYEEVERDE